MLTLINTLIAINLIVTMVFDSGFWDSADEWVNKKYKFHHLPHIFSCAFCQVWWLSLGAALVLAPYNIWAIVLCLVNAELTDFTLGFINIVKNFLMSVLDALNKHIK